MDIYMKLNSVCALPCGPGLSCCEATVLPTVVI
uniref:Uncharacterized protein n=1 Tax=Anguilla anguilla TaxID=7936 RepID=A0A0E9PGK6_ANGAN